MLTSSHVCCVKINTPFAKEDKILTSAAKERPRSEEIRRGISQQKLSSVVFE